MDQPQRSFGDELRAAREVKSLSLRDVERATGISNAHLSQLETGKIQKPSPQQLHKLAALYGVAYDFLMEKAGYIARQKGSDPEGRSAPKTLAGAALRSLEDLTPEEEEQIADYVAFLRSKRRKQP